ncbi:MAG: hypothetical protein JNM48_05840 [Rhodospirillales bacterium]|nr:hypothetical protein [Rhodospirillales bacterium]
MQDKVFRVSAFLSAASLAAGLGILAPGVAFAQQHPAATAPAKPGGAAPTAAKEDHPKMEAALQQLGKAKAELESAAHDFNGHRKKALELVNQASEEIRQGLASDKE